MFSLLPEYLCTELTVSLPIPRSGQKGSVKILHTFNNLLRQTNNKQVVTSIFTNREVHCARLEQILDLQWHTASIFQPMTLLQQATFSIKTAREACITNSFNTFILHCKKYLLFSECIYLLLDTSTKFFYNISSE